MNKVTIIEDAVTYIKELQKNVKVLSDLLMEMEASSSMKDAKVPNEEIDAAEEMEKDRIRVDYFLQMIPDISNFTRMPVYGTIKCLPGFFDQSDVKVANIDGNKLWMKITFEKRRGRLTKLMEALSGHGLELNDISVTTSMGATLISSCIQVIKD